MPNSRVPRQAKVITGHSDGTADWALAKRVRLAGQDGRGRFDQRSAAAERWRGGDQSAADFPPATADVLPARTSRRWSASAWLLARPGGQSSAARLIPRYGASQVGALVEYRLGGDAAPRAYVRASRALEGSGEAEVAAGVRLAIADLPIALHAERRFAVNEAGRNAVALFASGGFAAGDPSRFSVEAYGQAGIVGLRRRTPFADASIVAQRRIVERGPLSVSAGAGSWSGAQPGASRLDIGPRIEADFDDGLRARVALDWRERVAGDAHPDSGPALTLSLSF